MSDIRIARFLFFVLVMLASGLAAAPMRLQAATPEDEGGTCGPFRVDSRIYDGPIAHAPDKPIQHHVSLIAPGEEGLRAYDFVKSPRQNAPVGEVTIYDAARRRYVLIDLTRKLRLEMAQDDVARLVAHAQTLAEKEPGIARIAASGLFERELWSNDELLVLRSDALSYETAVQRTPQRQLAVYYRQFADAFAQWNTVRTGLPPRARFKLNEKIAERHAVPTYVALSAEFPDAGRVQQHSRHQFTWDWSDTDKRLVAQFDAAEDDYRRVAPQDFFDATARRK